MPVRAYFTREAYFTLACEHFTRVSAFHLGLARSDKPKFENSPKQKGHPKIGMSFSYIIQKNQNFRSTSTGIPVLSDSKAASMMSMSTIISWWVTICSHSPSMARTQLR